MQVKRFSWLKRPSAWEYAQAWRSHRANMVAQFRDQSNSLSTAFANAQNNLSVGMATLAAQASIARTQDEINAARNRITSAASSVNRLT